jgi:hypothetical protein
MKKMIERINVEDNDDFHSTLFDSSDDNVAQEAEANKSKLQKEASAKSNTIPSSKSSSQSNLSCQGVKGLLCNCCSLNCNSYEKMRILECKSHEEKPILECAFAIPEYRYVSLKKIYTYLCIAFNVLDEANYNQPASHVIKTHKVPEKISVLCNNTIYSVQYDRSHSF